MMEIASVTLLVIQISVVFSDLFVQQFDQVWVVYGRDFIQILFDQLKRGGLSKNAFASVILFGA